MGSSLITITDEEFEKLAKFIKSNYGINLKEEKKSLVMGRLRKVLHQKNMSSFSEYLDYVLSDKTGEAVSDMVNRITTNHTYFMRESKHFEFFKEEVLPYLKKKVSDKDLRIWSAGCSTGEEPYTLAMIIDEFFGKEKLFWNTQILATDISSKVLDVAKKGVYNNDSIAKMPSEKRLKYFKKISDEKSEVVDQIKKEVIFARLNLMNETFPFKKKFHTIFCRNVMIYFDSKTKMDLVNRFYEITEPGGYLFIGHSESLIRSQTKYKYIMPAVYRKE
ncbi:MAG: protein-glutamate O-methyltransferase CheR [Clostridiales bacterium]|nr:protein-glutamate O-methyltransferase CheR [Clostridiales bacterium]